MYPPYKWLINEPFYKIENSIKLQFIGYKKPHPLEKKIMFSIQGQNDNLDELINDIIKVGCNEIIKMLNKIQNELEGTSQFVNELKMIS